MHVVQNELSDLKVIAVSPDGAKVDEDLSVFGYEVAAEGEVAGGEVRHVEGAGAGVAEALVQRRHYEVQICLKKIKTK